MKPKPIPDERIELVTDIANMLCKAQGYHDLKIESWQTKKVMQAVYLINLVVKAHRHRPD